MATSELHNALLRPAILQILRASGFHSTRPAVLDALTDLAVRYISRLSASTAEIAFNTHNTFVPTVQDVRLALMDVGALAPQMGANEELARGYEELNEILMPFEDLRGVEAFKQWIEGSVNKEIRRIAGFVEEDGAGAGVSAEGVAELGELEDDYVTALKKKHAKSDTDSRYQGTELGRDADVTPVTIVGGPVTSLSEWESQLRLKSRSPNASSDHQAAAGGDSGDEMEGATPATSGISSAPATPDDHDMEP